MKRAETVKTELITAGVAEHQIKVASLGKDGAFCRDSSDACRMILPTTTGPKASEPMQPSRDQNNRAEDHGSLMDNLFPSFADPSTTEPSPLPTDSASDS